MNDLVHRIIGTQQEIAWWQMAIRAIIVFIVATALLRISNKRIFGKYSSFDIVIDIILGSILSRAITANAPFFATIIASIVLVFLHRFLGLLAWKNDFFEDLVKGRHQMLVKEGRIRWKEMARHNISRKDLEEAMRRVGHTSEVEKVKYAFLERSGDISIILKGAGSAE